MLSEHWECIDFTNYILALHFQMLVFLISLCRLCNGHPLQKSRKWQELQKHSLSSLKYIGRSKNTSTLEKSNHLNNANCL